ncbi:hypothetical protein AT15_05555 [Kosmotoga arenicorallina S304]|uniref:2Fe-2S ferredoxin-type domain-containing protein n=1 Tax=Kosmotoga arenicorallina S304 TaxID=1453497 RepID=A0A176K2N4_9BACT|nr:ASKHA domain-containing protein [Kosmotoga arenicorallina]OAA31540.1 hypothetical protein AT15_05555 [Kosmotoga arenicorallina S304]
MNKVKIRVLLSKGREINIEAEPGSVVLDVFKIQGIDINTPCGGQGTCGKCMIQCLPKSSFSEIQEDEVNILGERLKEGFRLACQTKVLADSTISLSESEEYLGIEVLKDRKRNPVTPFVLRKNIEIQWNGNADVLGEILEKLGGEVENKAIDFQIDIEDAMESVQVILNRDRIIKICEDDGKSGLGLAIDIGTTTVVTALVELSSGEVLDTDAFMNPQRRYGHDVISRINYACREREGLDELHDVIVNEINTALGQMLKRRNCGLEQLDQIVIAGNTTMSHIVARLPICTIGKAPYRPFTKLPVSINAKKLGFIASEHTGLYIFPSLSAYVGGDIVSGIIAASLLEEKGELYIDLGTNGEMVLNTGNELLCCSTAAGPAFEGANVECGLGNVTGAIEEVCFEAGEIKIKTIGQKTPKGICGSGLISVISNMLERKIINISGRFARFDQIPLEYRDRFDQEKKRFWLTDRIYISQKDIRNFQLAKSAVRTGIDTLLKKSGLKRPKAIRIAGGFGAHLSVMDLIKTGILPSGFDCPVVFEGNAAINGCVDLLLDQRYLEIIEKVRNSSHYIELSALKEFQDFFVKNLSF